MHDLFPYYAFTLPAVLTKTYAYHSRGPRRPSPAAALLHGIAANFKSPSPPHPLFPSILAGSRSVDKWAWVCFAAVSLGLHASGILLRVPKWGRAQAVWLGVNAAFLVKFYRVHLLSATLVPAPSPLLFSGVRELAALVSSGQYKVS